jgi:uncharacterized protein DUF3501
VRKVRRDEVLDLQRYEERRDEIRLRVFPEKARRRVHLGDALTFLFENRETILYQVQEMIRAERLVREPEIAHELETYNEVLGGDGELGCTLMVEIDDPEVRRARLREWRLLPEHLFARTADGRLVRPTFDERQRDLERLSAVQFLKFPVGASAPLALGCDLPSYRAEVLLTPDQRAALADDLA